MGGTREESVSDRHALRLDGSTRTTLMLRHRRERSTRAVTDGNGNGREVHGRYMGGEVHGVVMYTRGVSVCDVWSR